VTRIAAENFGRWWRARVIVEADPARIAQQVEVGERKIERRDHRAEREGEEADQPGQQEQIAGSPRPPQVETAASRSAVST
jgi:hypothetical protein